MLAVLYTTFALIDNEVPPAAMQAIRINVKNNAIRKIIIVTESRVNDILAVYHELDNNKIKFVHSDRRPTFRDMFDSVNSESFASSSLSTLAILLNSDISISDEETICRLESSINKVSRNQKKVAFSVTRYDRHKEGVEITLKSGMGLPNVLSSDAWVFNSKIECTKDLYYSLGQMYCDKFINHDLIESGYKLYNPCLDCKIIHNEDDVKDASYYKTLGGSQSAAESIKKHWQLSVKKGGNYYGLCRQRSTSMSAGYLPEPVKFLSSRKRLFVFLSDEQSEINKYLNVLENQLTLTPGHDLDVFFVVESNEQHVFIETKLAELRINTNIYNYFVDSIDDVIGNLFDGVHDTYESIGYTKCWDYISSDFIDLSGTVFFDARKSFLPDDIKNYGQKMLFTESNLSFWDRLNMLVGGVFSIKNDTLFSDFKIGESLVVAVYGHEKKDNLLQTVSRKEVKSLLFCTSEYAQYLYKKYSVEQV